MTDTVNIFALSVGMTFLVMIIGIPIFRRFLIRSGLLDNPNARSSHKTPVARGGGMIVLVSIVAGLAVLHVSAAALPTDLIVIVVIACALGCISWIDDIRSLSPIIRLVSQIIAVGSAIAIYPNLVIPIAPYFDGWVAMTLTALIWIWFVNLYNFMDGIDGMAGVETVSICAGLSLLALTGILSDDIILPLTVIGAAALAFLYWNWSPAKIFLGDVGSIPLGFLLGWFILQAINNGAWLAALIIPGYYLADATITLIKRASQRVPIWQAHREHFYQKPISYGISHQRIMRRIIFTNIMLIANAVWLVPINFWLGIIVATMTICTLLWNLSQLRT